MKSIIVAGVTMVYCFALESAVIKGCAEAGVQDPTRYVLNG